MNTDGSVIKSAVWVPDGVSLLELIPPETPGETCTIASRHGCHRVRVLNAPLSPDLTLPLRLVSMQLQDETGTRYCVWRLVAGA